MPKDAQQIYADFMSGFEEISVENAQAGAFLDFFVNQLQDGAIPNKYKELICVGIGTYNRCDYCITTHVNWALKAGATREEIIEAAMVGVAFGGGPSLAYMSTTLKDALDAFEGVVVPD
jgi:AhpD family alkylhydroperoxidase